MCPKLYGDFVVGHNYRKYSHDEFECNVTSNQIKHKCKYDSDLTLTNQKPYIVNSRIPHMITSYNTSWIGFLYFWISKNLLKIKEKGLANYAFQHYVSIL